MAQAYSPVKIAGLQGPKLCTNLLFLNGEICSLHQPDSFQHGAGSPDIGRPGAEKSFMPLRSVSFVAVLEALTTNCSTMNLGVLAIDGHEAQRIRPLGVDIRSHQRHKIGGGIDGSGDDGLDDERMRVQRHRLHLDPDLSEITRFRAT